MTEVLSHACELTNNVAARAPGGPGCLRLNNPIHSRSPHIVGDIPDRERQWPAEESATKCSTTIEEELAHGCE